MISQKKSVAKLFKQINKSYFVNVLINNATIDAYFNKKINYKNFYRKNLGYRDECWFKGSLLG